MDGHRLFHITAIKKSDTSEEASFHVVDLIADTAVQQVKEVMTKDPQEYGGVDEYVFITEAIEVEGYEISITKQ